MRDELNLLKSELFLLDGWFDRIRLVLADLNLLDRRPEAIWNVDESGFGDDPGRHQVIVRRSTRHVITAHAGTVKTYTTVLLCTSANGQ